MTIAVIGSIHVDFYIKTPKFPQPDETVLGKEFAMYPGGKGANQAVGCARLGVRTYMLSAVGDDFFGKIMVENLSKNNVVTDYIYVAKGVHTGVAFIILNEVSKENMIIVAPGADEAITPDYVENTLSSLTPRAVLTQLEIPIQTVYKTLEIGKKIDAITVLNPSPVKYLSSEIYKYVDVIIPNRVELQQLTGIEVRTEEDVFKAGECLLSRGVKVVVATLGARGAAVITYDKKKIVEAFKVDVVDTVGAGDAFAAGLAVALVEGRDIEEAVRFANAVAALKVTRMGAQSMPYREEVEKFLKKYL
ncbi:MAG: ribokinase [Desulfurococcaceae archaeon]|jgi:ribokinase|nr:ribokinase [Desulfurococcaceae archaeon]